MATYLGLEKVESPSEITEELTKALAKAASNNPFAGTIKDQQLKKRMQEAKAKLESSTSEILQRGPRPYNMSATWKNLFCDQGTKARELGVISEDHDFAINESESRKRRRGRF